MYEDFLIFSPKFWRFFDFYYLSHVKFKKIFWDFLWFFDFFVIFWVFLWFFCDFLGGVQRFFELRTPRNSLKTEWHAGNSTLDFWCFYTVFSLFHLKFDLKINKRGLWVGRLCCGWLGVCTDTFLLFVSVTLLVMRCLWLPSAIIYAFYEIFLLLGISLLLDCTSVKSNLMKKRKRLEGK